VGSVGAVLLLANQFDLAAQTQPARQRANWLEPNSPSHGVPDQFSLFGGFIVESFARFFELL